MKDQAEVIRAEVAPVLAQAVPFVPVTVADVEIGGRIAVALAGAEKRVHEEFDPLCKATDEAHKAATAQRAKWLNPIVTERKRIQGLCAAIIDKAERDRKVEEARLQALADAAAERERARLAKEAAKLKTPELRDARLEQAAAVVAPVMHVAAAVPKIEGQHSTRRWKAVVHDPRALVLHMVNNWDDWAAYVTINQAELDRRAGRSKGTACTVPGMTYREEIGLASRGR